MRRAGGEEKRTRGSSRGQGHPQHSPLPRWPALAWRPPAAPSPSLPLEGARHQRMPVGNQPPLPDVANCSRQRQVARRSALSYPCLSPKPLTPSAWRSRVDAPRQLQHQPAEKETASACSLPWRTTHKGEHRHRAGGLTAKGSSENSQAGLEAWVPALVSFSHRSISCRKVLPETPHVYLNPNGN